MVLHMVQKLRVCQSIELADGALIGSHWLLDRVLELGGSKR